MKDEIKISILIVNYNSFILLENCLSSLVKHTQGVNYEIIVVDNNSTEGDIESITSKFSNIVLITSKLNLGFGAANNQGLAVAKGKYILFLNNDTIFFENSIKKVFDFAESKDKSIIVGCKLLNEDQSLQRSVYDFPTLRNVFTSNFFLYALFPKSKYFNKYHYINRKINRTTEVDVVTGAFLFCTKDSIIKINGFDERFFFFNEETDLCYRFKNSGGKVYYFPETAIVHLKGGTAKKTSWFTQKNQSVATIKFFQKHFYGTKYSLAITFHYSGILIRIPVFFLIGLFTFNVDLVIRAFYYIKLLFVFPANDF